MTTDEPTPTETTIRRIIRVIYGRALTHDTPIGYSRMSRDERDALLEPHVDDIDKDTEVLAELVERAYQGGWAAAHAHVRSADAFDPEAVDEVMASPLAPDADADPEDVPRGPFAGGWL